MRYVGGMPIVNSDPSGTIAPIIAGGVVAGAAAACIGPHFLWMRSTAGKEWNHDKFAHCVVSCRASKTCAGFLSLSGGLLKEVADLLGLGTADLTDVLANVDGAACAGWEANALGPIGAGLGALCGRESCADCCEKRHRRWK
jgi:hypothetical protein